jgi:hypothetical protein
VACVATQGQVKMPQLWPSNLHVKTDSMAIGIQV